MTSNRPEAKTITAKGEELLAIIRGAGAGGIDRAALAKATGKPTLNKWQIAQLELLADQGHISVTTRPSARPHILEYVYVTNEE